MEGCLLKSTIPTPRAPLSLCLQSQDYVFGLKNGGSQRVNELLKVTGEFAPSWISSPHNSYYASCSYNVFLSPTKLAHEPKLD